MEDSLAYWQEQRTPLVRQLADLESGKALRSERILTGWVDKSPAAMAASRSRSAISPSNAGTVLPSTGYPDLPRKYHLAGAADAAT